VLQNVEAGLEALGPLIKLASESMGEMQQEIASLSYSRSWGKAVVCSSDASTIIPSSTHHGWINLANLGIWDRLVFRKRITS
jgi:hypothetical protein